MGEARFTDLKPKLCSPPLADATRLLPCPTFPLGATLPQSICPSPSQSIAQCTGAISCPLEFRHICPEAAGRQVAVVWQRREGPLLQSTQPLKSLHSSPAAAQPFSGKGGTRQTLLSRGACEGWNLDVDSSGLWLQAAAGSTWLSLTSLLLWAPLKSFSCVFSERQMRQVKAMLYTQ